MACASRSSARVIWARPRPGCPERGCSCCDDGRNSSCPCASGQATQPNFSGLSRKSTDPYLSLRPPPCLPLKLTQNRSSFPPLLSIFRSSIRKPSCSSVRQSVQFVRQSVYPILCMLVRPSVSASFWPPSSRNAFVSPALSRHVCAPFLLNSHTRDARPRWPCQTLSAAQEHPQLRVQLKKDGPLFLN